MSIENGRLFAERVSDTRLVEIVDASQCFAGRPALFGEPHQTRKQRPFDERLLIGLPRLIVEISGRIDLGNMSRKALNIVEGCRPASSRHNRLPSSSSPFLRSPRPSASAATPSRTARARHPT
jgi:hypothetical protein